MKLSKRSGFVFFALLCFIVVLTSCHKNSDDTAVFVPALTTGQAITDVSSTSVQGNGYITNFVANTLSAYGLSYSATNQTPTLADAATTLTTANVIHFVSTITGLKPGTTYYMRAYATGNSGSTQYGNVVQFTTPTATFSITATTSTFAGSGAAGYTDGTGRAAVFNNPQGIIADAAGNLYVADAFNNLIRKVTPAGVVTTFAGSTTAGYVNATGTAARFYSPQALAIDASGYIYVSDAGNNAIRKITTAGVVTTVAGGAGAGYANNTGALAKFNSPLGLVLDAGGNIFVADRGNNVIRKVTAAGVVSTYAGAQSSGFADGISASARFNNPSGLTIDSKGVIYVADLSNSAIRQIATDTTVTTLAGDPVNRPDLLNLPVGLTIDLKGNIFISDESGRILEITAAKAVYSIAGAANSAGYVEGRGLAAAFNNPQGLTTDAAGNVYIADYGNNVIRKLVITVVP